MKKIIIVFSVFIVLSFFFTSLFITSIENNDSLMQEIKNKSTKYQVKAINAEITGNSIISDGWAGYNFLNSVNSGYIHITHMHLGESFGFGLE